MRQHTHTGFIWSIDLLSHLVRQRINRLLAPLQLTFPKYAAMTVLESRPGLTNAELARACQVRPQTMNTMVKDMMKERHVSQEKQPDHRLKLLYTLTPQALALLQQAHATVELLEGELVTEISPERVQMLQRMMQGTLTRLEQTEQDRSQ